MATALSIAMLATLMLTAPAAGQVSASIEVTPSFGAAGDEITITGVGFVDVCGVDISWNQAGVSEVIGFSYTNDEGSFETTVAVPSTATTGDARILAIGLPAGVEFCFGEPAMTAAASFTVQGDPGGLVPRFIPVKPIYEAPLGDGFSRTEIHLKIVQDADVRLVDGALDDGREFSELGELLFAYPEVEITRLFSARSEEELAAEKARLEARSGREQGDKNLYFVLTIPDGTDAVVLLNSLNELDIVELAYPAPLPGVDPALDDYEDLQGYRVSAGSGIHADAANTIPGGNGENVQIIDIERFFNPNHEDLPPVAVYPNGDIMANTSPPYDHGTAVMGQIFALDNANGMRGLANQAAAGFVSTAGGRANAIDVAAANSSPGDVILLELQVAGPNGPCSNATTPGQIGCVPQEFQQASYDAIVAAVAAGIIVVAAAGNGRQNLDDPVYAATLGARPDSGAIMVGAGAAGDDDSVTGVRTCTGPERGRLNFSNFGSRVDVQGWGRCVATLGYGTIEGSSDSNNAYHSTFGGTSSASPIVAAAAGILSSVAIANGDADGLSSTEARALLVATGTPQDTSPAALAGNIGPLPNLAAALGLQADVSVTKTADPEPVIAGEDVTYTIAVTNNGPNVATDVVVTDDLPANADLVSADAACEVAAGDLTCPLGTLAVGEVVELEVVMDVPAGLVHDAGGPTVVTNAASVTSTIADPNPGNNDTSVDSNVTAVADLAITKTASPEPVIAGEDLTYTIAVTNNGPSVASDVVVTDDLPANADLVSADPSCVVVIGDLSCSVGALGVGETVELEVVMGIPADLVHNAGGPTIVTNAASVTSATADPNLGNNDTSVDTNVIAVADLAVDSTTVIDPPIEAIIGEDIAIVVETTVSNGGPSSPMDANLDVVATPTAGASVSPAADTTAVDALAAGAPQVIEQAFTIRCDAPGVQTIDFEVAISPANAADADPDPTNNTGADSVSLECITPIVINVRPGNAKNQINLNGNAKVPVAFLTTAAGEYGLPIAFDATQIVADSVRFGNGDAVYDQTGGAPRHSGVDLIGDMHELDDKTKDGDDDLRLQFDTSLADLQSVDVEACARGQYIDGGVTYTFFGCDAVTIK